MKISPSFSMLGLLILIVGCTAPKASVDADPVVTVNDEPRESTNSEELSLIGTFASKKGVMHQISCYCSNGGVLTTEEDKRILLCFKEDAEACKQIEVTGTFISKRIDRGPTNPCPAGELRYFEVKSFSCN